MSRLSNFVSSYSSSVTSSLFVVSTVFEAFVTLIALPLSVVVSSTPFIGSVVIPFAAKSCSSTSLLLPLVSVSFTFRPVRSILSFSLYFRFVGSPIISRLSNFVSSYASSVISI